MSDFEKPLVRACFFEKSYKNTRTKIPVTPYGVTGIFCAEMGLERPLRKHAGGYMRDVYLCSLSIPLKSMG